MNAKDIKICVVKEKDIDGMVMLLDELFSIETDFKIDIFKQKRGLELLLEDKENICIMGAYDGDRIIGMCTMQVLVSTAEGAKVGLVEDMIISEAFRSMGIGTDLLDALESWAKKKNLKRVQLLADKRNKQALGFYKKRGYSVTNMIGVKKVF